MAAENMNYVITVFLKFPFYILEFENMRCYQEKCYAYT